MRCNVCKDAMRKKDVRVCLLFLSFGWGFVCFFRGVGALGYGKWDGDRTHDLVKSWRWAAWLVLMAQAIFATLSSVDLREVVNKIR